MKTFRNLAFGLFIATMAWSCQPEGVSPEQGPKDVLGTYIPVPRPAVQCGPAIYTRMKAGNLDLGGVEIFNSADLLYFYMDLNQHKYLEEIKVFRGDARNIPTNLDGSIQPNQFQTQYTCTSPLNDYSLSLPLAGQPACNDLVIWARITTRGTLGNVVATHYGWMMGSPLANAYKVNFCIGPCPTGNVGDGSVN